MTEPRLYYAQGACSLASHIALEETGAPFRPVVVDTKAGEHQRPDFLRVNPKARVPALAIDDWVLTESPAILQFVGQTWPAAELWPQDLRDQARVVEWLGWIASTVHVAYAHIRRTERYATSDAAKADVRAKGLRSSRELWLDVDRRLTGGPWAVGDRYTVADAYLLVFWTWGRGPVLDFDMPRECPTWTEHARRMAQRPAVRRAFEREGLPLPA